MNKCDDGGGCGGGQTDGRTSDRYVDPGSHSMRTVSIYSEMTSQNL